MAKYTPLAEFLEKVDSSERRITLSFAEVDRLVGGLPPTARRLRQWWANDSKVQARAWRSAGWHVAERGVDLNEGFVVFERGRVGGTRARRLGLE